VYNIQFTLDNTKRLYNGNINIVDGAVKEIEVGEIVE
jgi:hypothetical protein